jgi:PAS domain S-box-containing protein
MSLIAGVLTVLVVALAVAYHRSLKIVSRSLSNAATVFKPTPIDRVVTKIPFFGNQTILITTMVERLKQSHNDHQNRYKILTENVAAAVILHESDGTILWCSPFTEVLTGFPLSEVYRAKETFLKTNVHEEDRETVERSLKIVSTGEPFQCRYRFYHKSGMVLWLETRTVPILDNSSDNYVALSISIDVTAQVMNQMQIEERNRDLNEFTYMISHDLKAPILTISGMLGILEGDEVIQSSSTLAEPLTYIRKATRRLQDLVTGVLELAKISASDRTLEPVALKEVLDEVLEDHRLQIERSAATITTIEELPVVLGNKTQLYQVFSNLIGNAIKYQNIERPLVISVGTDKASSRRRTSITVSDNGRGITPDKLDTIFKPFNRGGEDTIEGTGVGLASVKKLVERLGGSIQVASQIDSGTSFTIELRRAPDA